MRKFVLAALMAAPALAAVPALAQDQDPFTGPRIEGIVGWDRSQVSGGKEDGVLYGAVLGYDMRAGGAIVGVDAEITDSTADACVRDVSVIGDRLCAGAKRDLYIGGRVGTQVGQHALIYGKAGYTNARYGIDYDDGGNGANDYGTGTNLDGIRVGAGVEYALGPNSFIKGEYRYSNYEQGFEKHQALAGFGFRF